MKLQGCFTGVLLVPGWVPGRLLAVDLGRVATLEAQQDEFSLAGRLGGVTRSASRDAEFSLVALPSSSSFVDVAASVSEAVDELLQAAWEWLVQGQARSWHPSGERQAASHRFS